jgi:hypothetical protein
LTETAAAVANQATTGIIVVTLILQIFASKMIKYIWPLFNTVQLCLAFFFLSVHLPTNVDMILKTLKGIIELEALPREEIKEYFLENAAAKYFMDLEPLMLLVMFALPGMFLIIAIILIV